MVENITTHGRHVRMNGDNVWLGIMSDGVTVQFHMDNNIIKTAFPKF